MTVVWYLLITLVNHHRKVNWIINNKQSAN